MISRDRMKFSDIERSFPGVAYERAQGFRVRVRLPHGEIWSTRVMSCMYDVRGTRDLSWSWSVPVGTRLGRFGHVGATHSDVLARVRDRGAECARIRKVQIFGIRNVQKCSLHGAGGGRGSTAL